VLIQSNAREIVHGWLGWLLISSGMNAVVLKPDSVPFSQQREVVFAKK